MGTLTDKSNFFKPKSQPTVGKSLSWPTEGSPLARQNSLESREVKVDKYSLQVSTALLPIFFFSRNSLFITENAELSMKGHTFCKEIPVSFSITHQKSNIIIQYTVVINYGRLNLGCLKYCSIYTYAYRIAEVV